MSEYRKRAKADPEYDKQSIEKAMVGTIGRVLRHEQCLDPFEDKEADACDRKPYVQIVDPSGQRCRIGDQARYGHAKTNEGMNDRIIRYAFLLPYLFGKEIQAEHAGECPKHQIEKMTQLIANVAEIIVRWIDPKKDGQVDQGIE